MSPPSPSRSFPADSAESTAHSRSPMESEEEFDNPRKADATELPKSFNLEDPFHFAPSPPDGDPWMILLEPLLKKDQQRCDSWRDEVQNLLIFAGLFSAVVTTFVIESYKGLQQDPNAVMIGLLSHIAARLDAPLTPTTNSILMPIDIPKFSPSAASIRVNSFWFSSLMLSLMTVLVGTISLQWLREHQTYSDLTPREMYAVYHMRNKALEVWHVDKVFTSLPLFLQCALVLFLLGVVDFLHPFGQLAVTLPVAILIFLTLFFLVATTVVPNAHTLWWHYRLDFFSHLKWNIGHKPEPPTPCPYKSPQSHAIRTVIVPLFNISVVLIVCVFILKLATFILKVFIMWPLKIIMSYTHTDSDANANANVNGNPDVQKKGRETRDGELVYVADFLDTSRTFRWLEYDMLWLGIRDVYMRLAYRRKVPDESVGLGNDHIVAPVLDVVRGLCQQNRFKATCGAAYACFVEVSKETLEPLWDSKYKYDPDSVIKKAKGRYKFFQSAYLHDLVSGPTMGVVDVFRMDDMLISSSSETGTMSFSPATFGEQAVLSSFFHDRQLMPDRERLYTILHLQNMHAFMVNYGDAQTRSLDMHAQELSLRLSEYFYTSRLRLHATDEASDHDANQPLSDDMFPRCLTFRGVDNYGRKQDRKSFNIIAYQVTHVMSSFLQSIEASRMSAEHVILNPAIQGVTVSAFIQGVADFTSYFMFLDPHVSDEDKEPSRSRLKTAVDETLDEIFDFVADSLQREMASWAQMDASEDSDESREPSVLFYIAALYASPSLPFTRMVRRHSFERMRVVIRMYKQRTIDMGLVNCALEERLTKGSNLRSESIREEEEEEKPFSTAWWKRYEQPAILDSLLYDSILERAEKRYYEV